MQNFAPGKRILEGIRVLERWQIIRLKLGDLQLDVRPGIGGRLWNIEIHGNSLLFQNPDLTGLSFELKDLQALPTQSPQYGFPLWGGEKTWIAPDTLWPRGAPFADLDSGAYQVISQDKFHLEMISPVCSVSQLSVSRKITLNSASSWTIEHKVRNHGNSNRKTGIWSVMMLNSPARIAVHMDHPSSLRVFGSDKGLVALKRNCVVVDCSKRQEFKLGLRNPDGHTFIKLSRNGPWLKCSVPPPQHDNQYAHELPFEVFNSGDYDYCETEWHSPVKNLDPGKELNFKQSFQIFTDHNEIETLSHHKELISCMS